MVSRDKQGLQIALILFVMVTVVLGVTTYMYFRKAEEKIKEAAAFRAAAQQRQELLLALESETEAFRHVLGYDTQTPAQWEEIKRAVSAKGDMQHILNNFDQDMTRWGAGLAPGPRNYRAVPESLTTTLEERNREAADNLAALRSQSEKHDHALEAERGRTRQAEDQLQKQADDYASARKLLNDVLSRIRAEKDQLAETLANQRVESSRVASKAEEELEALNKRLSDITNLYEQVREQVRRRDDERKVETPAGKIDWVDQAARLVWINRGSADGVARRMTFAVFDQKETGLTKAKVKGRLEVTRIVGPAQAEARIIQETDELRNPIMKNDMIYSPSFHRGRKTHVALIGLIDSNGDGKSDRARVKSIIALNNGVVDAELLEDGTIVGKITLDTDWVVRGDRPDERAHANLMKGYTEMIGEATKLGKDLTPLKAFLDRMGFSGDSRVTLLNRGGAADARAKPDTYRPRHPGGAL